MKKIIYLLLLNMTIFFLGCNSGPSNDKVTELVKKYWDEAPRDWVDLGKYLRGVTFKNTPDKIKSITKIEIQKRGEISSDGKKQKMVVNIEGVAKTIKLIYYENMPYNMPAVKQRIDTEDETFRTIHEYEFVKDDYNEWSLFKLN